MQVLLKCIATPHGRECTRLLHVLAVHVHCRQVQSNHSAMGTLHPYHSATFFLYVRPTLCCVIPCSKEQIYPSLLVDPTPTIKEIIHQFTWPTIPNDIIGAHTLNCCDYFCRINWSELVYGYFFPRTLQSHDTLVPGRNLYPKTTYCTNPTTTTG